MCVRALGYVLGQRVRRDTRGSVITAVTSDGSGKLPASGSPTAARAASIDTPVCQLLASTPRSVMSMKSSRLKSPFTHPPYHGYSLRRWARLGERKLPGIRVLFVDHGEVALFR